MSSFSVWRRVSSPVKSTYIDNALNPEKEWHDTSAAGVWSVAPRDNAAFVGGGAGLLLDSREENDVVSSTPSIVFSPTHRSKLRHCIDYSRTT